MMPSALAFLLVTLAALLRCHTQPLQHPPAIPDVWCDCRSTFRFTVCNGFANQRIAFVLGVILAKENGGVLRLPDLLLEGAVGEGPAPLLGVPMAHFYNVSRVRTVLGRHSISTVPLAMHPSACRDLPAPCRAPVERHTIVGCPFGDWLVTPQQVVRHENLVLDTLAALQPSEGMLGHLQAALHHIHRFAPDGRFGFLHVRLERDWQTHCQRWTNHQRDNCLTNTWYLPEQLLAKGFDRSVPLYVTSYWPMVNPSERSLLISQLRRAGYRLIPDPPTAPGLRREEAAMVQYHVGLRAVRSLGNSVSTFSALLMLERRVRGLPAAQYNGGNVPLALLMPLYRLPWLFPLGPSSDHTMVRAAVLSATSVGRVAPYCIHSEPLPVALRDWLLAHGVTLIPHRPEWSPWLADRFPDAPSGPLLRSFLRIDAPLLEPLRQYDFILTSGPYVLFRRPVSLDSFPYPLPPIVGVVSPGLSDRDVALFTLDGLRKAHRPLLESLRTQLPQCPTPTLGAPAYCALRSLAPGPGGWTLPEHFDALAYRPFDNASAIVHMRGPRIRPNRSRPCPGACNAVDCRALCQYAGEWAQYLDPHDPALPALRQACGGGRVSDHRLAALPAALRRPLLACNTKPTTV